jgi:hypothetical protein
LSRADHPEVQEQELLLVVLLILERVLAHHMTGPVERGRVTARRRTAVPGPRSGPVRGGACVPNPCTTDWTCASCSSTRSNREDDSARYVTTSAISRPR